MVYKINIYFISYYGRTIIWYYESLNNLIVTEKLKFLSK